jgi:hypothetical protein
MSIRLVAAAKGLAVGVLTVCFSVIGGYAYAMSGFSACRGFGADRGCTTVTSVSIVAVLLALMLVLGPLLAWGFLLPLPGGYVIPAFLTATVDSVLLCAGLPREFLLVAPFAAFPVIAVLTADRRRMSPAPAPSPSSPASP